ncbi:uncharacterized protein [Montipora capricornis]|uniref:uncharacterized protein n=1 Tax=Montipora capricornis TaxID=246305 RepID=UPI0035F14898
MVNHSCRAFNCSNSTYKKKHVEKHPELENIEFFPFPPDNKSKYYVAGMTERERRMRWIAACRLDSPNVTRHTRICSAHFKGGLGPTKSNPVPTIFDFPKHLQPKIHKSRTNPDERKHRNAKPELKKEINMEQSASSKQDVRVEGMDLSSDKNNCTFEGNRNPDCQPVYVDAEVQTDLTTSDIQFMDECKARLENKTQLKRDLFIEDVFKDDRSVRFYTGIPLLTCLLMVFNFLQPFAEKMKYWDGKKKTAREAYQEEKDRKKPGPKRQVPLFAEFILVMVRLRLGLLKTSDDIIGRNIYDSC